MKIKVKPSDFRVREVVRIPPENRGDWAWFRMRKILLTTPQAVKRIARGLGISRRRIYFAGEKDKFAITEQFISIAKFNPKRRVYTFDRVKIFLVGQKPEPVTIKLLEGNEFEIVVRDVKEEELERFRKNVDVFSEGFLNYFDDQRFGNQRSVNHIIGKLIVLKRWEDACKVLLTEVGELEGEDSKRARRWLAENWGNWKQACAVFPRNLDVELAVLGHLVQKPDDFRGALRKIHKQLLKLFINAFQSWIWNRSVSLLVESMCSDRFPIHTSAGKLWSTRGFFELPESVPLVGCDTREEKLPDFVRRVLDEEGVSVSDFEFPETPSLTTRGGERKVVVKPANFRWEILDDGKAVKLSFFLPKGSFATMFIKHLFA